MRHCELRSGVSTIVAVALAAISASGCGGKSGEFAGTSRTDAAALAEQQMTLWKAINRGALHRQSLEQQTTEAGNEYWVATYAVDHDVNSILCVYVRDGEAQVQIWSEGYCDATNAETDGGGGD